MAKSRVRGHQFKLVTRGEGFCLGQFGREVTLMCCLVPETNAVSMTVRWYRESECIYIYKNGRTISGRGYEGRLSLNLQDLRRGNLSLTLRDYRKSDDGVYICGVKHGKKEQEVALGLVCYQILESTGGCVNKDQGYFSKEQAEQNNGMLTSTNLPGSRVTVPPQLTAPPGFTAVSTKTFFTGLKVVRLSASPTQLPQLSLCVSGKMVRFLVDTGSTISCLRQKDLKCPLSKHSVRHAGIGGDWQVEPLSLPLLIDLDGLKIEHSFLVSPTVPMSMLGRDLLNTFNATV